MNSSTFTLWKEIYGNKPEDLPKKSMVRQNVKLWYKVAQLHLQDHEDMEKSIAVLRKSLPLVPNWNTGKIPVQAQYAPTPGPTSSTRMPLWMWIHRTIFSHLGSRKHPTV